MPADISKDDMLEVPDRQVLRERYARGRAVSRWRELTAKEGGRRLERI